MNFQNLFEMQAMLFLIMFLGTFLKLRGMITKRGKQLLTDLVVSVTLPCSIFKSFQMELPDHVFQTFLVVFLVALGIQVGSYVLSLILYPGMKEQRKKVLQYATICSNAGILGNPIAEGIFGSLGLLYASIYLIPQRIFMWSVGLTYFTQAENWKKLVKKVVTHPCIVAVVLGMAVMIFGIPVPGFVSLAIKNVAGANTAVSMLLIGSILADLPVRELADKEAVYYTVIRLILIPLLVYGACLFLGIDSLVMGVSVVLAAMPAASTTAVLASKYHADEVFATKCVVLSTLCSVVSIPAWCFVLA